MALKQHNSLMIEYPLEGLPSDWRRRVEGVVRQASPAFDLYVTNVKAGSRKEPEGILVSIARDGAEEAWSERVERVIGERIVDEMESSKAEARDKQSMQIRFELGWDPEAGARVSSTEDLSHMPASERLNLIARRHALTSDLRIAFQAEEFHDSTMTFVGTALKQMEYPERWALWARLLLVVIETEAALPMPLQRRLMELA